MLGEWEKQKNYQSNIMVEMQFRKHIKRSEGKKREMLHFERVISWNTMHFLSWAVKIHPVSKETGTNCLHHHPPQSFVPQDNPEQSAGEREGKGNAQKCPGVTFHSLCLRAPVVFSSLIITAHFSCCHEEWHSCSLQSASYLWSTTFLLIYSTFSQNA